MRRHIVVPLDQSRFAEFALPVAFSILRDGDRLEIVSALEPPPPLAWEGYERIAVSEVEHYLDDILGQAEAAVGREVEIDTRLLRGEPAVALGAYAREIRPTMIVMTSHGRGPVSRVWLGSVTDSLLRQASVPVLVVRPEEEETLRLEPMPGPRRVVVPLDGSEIGEQVLGRLPLLGAPDQLEVRLVRVVTYPRTVASAYLPHTVLENRITVEEERAWVEGYLDRAAKRLRESGYPTVETDAAVDTTAAGGILQSAESFDADVIALATHGRRGFDRLLLGSVADKVIRGAHRPVLVMPSPRSLWVEREDEESDAGAETAVA